MNMMLPPMPADQMRPGGVPSTYGERAIFGTDGNHLAMPGCHNQETVLLMAERFQRDDAALSAWADTAKQCVDMSEGRQWTQKEIAAAEAEGRPVMSFNKIGPLLRLVLGYHRQNRIEHKYLPANDHNASHVVAQSVTKIVKHIDANNSEEYIDTEVFLDGMMGGRGFFDYRLSFEHNDFGDIASSAKDPFSIRLDSDADTYEPEHWGRVTEARWWSIDEVEFIFGKVAASLVAPLVYAGGYRGGVGSSLIEMQEELAPWRNFGGGDNLGIYDNPIAIYLANSFDPYRKVIRVIDQQHYIRVMQRNILNLETGDRQPIPGHFTAPQIQKLMMWCAEQYAAKGKACPLQMQYRPTRRVRWTTMVGDLVVHDDWSPYESLTTVPYFPYFRRGKTRGMVEDLLDPQREVNRRRSANVDIVERTAHSGWMWHEKSMREPEKQKVEKYGAASGINIEWRGDATMKPEKIQPGTPPMAMERLEEKATLDLKEIAGINDAALGNLDRVQSGRAIEARTRQSVLGIEMYNDNWKRTKKIGALKKLQLVQNHYTEPRVFQILGPDSNFITEEINKRQATGEILNDVTVGRYTAVVDETPISASFLGAQFEEAMELVEKGILPIPIIQDIIVRASSLPQKELIMQRMNAYAKAQGFLTMEELIQAQASGLGVLPGQVPPPGPTHGAGAAPAGGDPKKDPNAEGGGAVSAGSPTQSMQPQQQGAPAPSATGAGMY